MLYRTGLIRCNQLKPKARSFCSFTQGHRFRQNYQCLCHRTARLFYPISPEAAGLTVLSIRQDHLIYGQLTIKFFHI
jgi:hypothetical protein